MSHAAHESVLAGKVRAVTGVDPARCYQCGKCTAGCPMATEMPVRIQQIMRRLQRGDGLLLQEPSLWLCLTCETCSERCPQGAEPARVVDALRELALRAGDGAGPRAIRAFHEAFLEQIRMNGRLFEFGLVLGFKMRTGDLLSDVTTAPAMLARGKLAFTPNRIEGVDEVRRIFERCAREAGTEEA